MQKDVNACQIFDSIKV